MNSKTDNQGTTCTCKPNDPCYYHKDQLMKETDTEFMPSKHVLKIDVGHLEPGKEIEEAMQRVRAVIKRPLKNTGYYDLDLFLDDVFKTMREKGHDYRQGNDADLLHNFRTVAGSVDTPMEKVWATYAYKHWAAIMTFIKENGQSESEPIEGRIKDMIVYLILFYRMITEAKRVKAGDTFPVSVKFPELNDPDGQSWFHKTDELLSKMNRSNETGLPLMAEKFEVAEKGSAVPVELPVVGMTGRPVGSAEIGSLSLMPIRMQELAGLRKGPAWRNNVTGEEAEAGDIMVKDNLPPALVENIKRTQEILNERDQEAADRANGKGFDYKPPGVDEFDMLPCGCEVAVGVYECMKHPGKQTWDPTKFAKEDFTKQ